MDKQQQKPKLNLIPARARLLYLCADQELHEISLWVWLGRIVSRRDRAIVHVPALMGMLYNMTDRDGASDEKVPEGATIQ